MKRFLLISMQFLLIDVVVGQLKSNFLIENDEFRTELKFYLDKEILFKHWIQYENKTNECDCVGDYDPKTINFLKKEASFEELIKLSNSKYARLRFLSFEIFLQKNDPQFYKLLIDHLSDSIKVSWQMSYDSFGYDFLPDVMLSFAHNKLNRSQKDVLVDSVLHNHLYLNFSNWMMESINPQGKYYQIIKTNAKLKIGRCNQDRAVYALAKFKKTEDLLFIKKFLSDSWNDCHFVKYRIIETFPDWTLWEFLENEFRKQLSENEPFYFTDIYYYRAVAAFKNQKSLEILKTIADAAMKFESEEADSFIFDIFKSIHLHYSSIYEILYEKLKTKIDPKKIKELNKPEINEASGW